MEPGVSEAYRYACQAHEAAALARMAEARALRTVANSRGDIVTCSGCKAAEQGGDWGQANCRELRAAGLCQRQVYARVTLARLVVEAIRILCEAGASEGTVRAVVGAMSSTAGCELGRGGRGT